MHLKNQVYIGSNKRQSLIDLNLPNNDTELLVLFIHGYKGYKDWGCWNLVEEFFVDKGIGFCKLNLSHNGGTIDSPIDFSDLEAFGENRYTYELEDIAEGIDWIFSKIDMTNKQLFLIGHSRGGGDVILSSEDERVNGIITWASISDIGSRFPTGKELQKWKEDGVRYIENARTKQQMPHYFSFYEDWFYNQDLLNIESAAKSIEKPCLHIHGDNDEAVSFNESKSLSKWTKGELVIIKGANHTFGSSHPWNSNLLPQPLAEVCQKTYEFIQSIN